MATVITSEMAQELSVKAAVELAKMAGLNLADQIRQNDIRATVAAITEKLAERKQHDEFVSAGLRIINAYFCNDYSGYDEK